MKSNLCTMCGHYRYRNRNKNTKDATTRVSKKKSKTPQTIHRREKSKVLVPLAQCFCTRSALRLVTLYCILPRQFLPANVARKFDFLVHRLTVPLDVRWAFGLEAASRPWTVVHLSNERNRPGAQRYRRARRRRGVVRGN